MPNYPLNRALAALAGALPLLSRYAGHVGNLARSNIRSKGGLLLFGTLLAVSQLFLARVADAQALRLQDSGVSESVGTATIRIRNTSGGTVTVTSWSTSDGTATAGSDYTAASSSANVVLGAGADLEASITVADDDDNEGSETFTITVNFTRNALSASSDFTVTIFDDDRPGVTVTPSEVSEGETAEFTVALNAGWAAVTPEDPTFTWRTEDGTATDGQDYTGSTGASIGQSLVSGSSSAPQTFSIEIADEGVADDGETFTIVIEAPQPPGVGAGSIATLRHEVTIRDGPMTPVGSDPILAENANHLLAQSEALLAAQPRLADYARNTGIGASDFQLRVSNRGLEALDGGFASEGFWGDAAFSRSGSRGADGSHVVASLGAHRQVSDIMLLGGMLQFDRTVTKLDGGGRSGEFVSEGWMAGPYVVARDPSRSLFFEGRLLYGNASHDADAVVADSSGAKNGTFDSERWVAQARVEGEYPLGAGAIMYPLADLSHARNAGDGFDETPDDQGQETDLDVAVRTSVSKLQLGAEFEIPLDPAKGDLVFRPGLKLVVADRKGVAFGKTEDLDSSGRVDIGIDYRLDDGIALGFQGYYSGIGGEKDFETYGAGLRLRMEF